MNTIFRTKDFHEAAVVLNCVTQLMREGDVVAINGVRDEAYLFEDGQPRRIRACVLPDGYFGTPQRSVEVPINYAAAYHAAMEGSQATSVRVDAKRAFDEGFESMAEKARARLREYDQNMRRVERNRRPVEAASRVREFHPSDLYDHPEDTHDVGNLRNSLATTLAALVSTADYDPACEIVQLKMWDGLCHMAERALFNCEEQGHINKREIARLYRESDSDSEIPIQQIERLEERVRGLRVQWSYFKNLLDTARKLRDAAVQTAGINWPAYRSIEERASQGVKAYRQTKRHNDVMAALHRMTDAEYRVWIRSPQRQYRPRFDGVDGTGAQNSPSADPS